LSKLFYSRKFIASTTLQHLPLEIACARLEITQTAALEEAIRDWLEKKGFPAGEKQQGS